MAALLIKIHVLHLQQLQHLINQHSGPKQGFEDTKRPHPECSRMLDKIDRRAEKSHPIDTSKNTVPVIFHSFTPLLIMCSWIPVIRHFVLLIIIMIYSRENPFSTYGQTDSPVPAITATISIAVLMYISAI